MRVSEIFYSLQGEGVHTGIPTLFLRLQGCNLHPSCSWCDTSYAIDPSGGTTLSPVQVLANLESLSDSASWLCITGGEPLMQAEAVGELIPLVHTAGYDVEIFTNGSFLPPKWHRPVDSWVVDIKGPSSGVAGTSKVAEWTQVLGGLDTLKFVAATEQDLAFIRGAILTPALVNATDRGVTIMVSPVIWNKLDAKWLQVVADFCKVLNLRYSLQTHRVIWGNKKGV